MKKVLTIVLAVALYSCLETVVLLSILTPYRFGIRHDAYLGIVGWGQLLVIPSMAALFSRMIYGAQGWWKRAIKILLAGALGPPLFMTLIGAIGVVIAWAASVNLILFVVLFVVLGGGVILGMIWIAGRMIRRSVPIEAGLWLEQRRLQPNDRKRRSLAIRLALCIPSLTVLVVGTFLMPIWGVLSHITQPGAGNFGQFCIPVPLTSVVLYSDQDSRSGDAWASFMSGHGSPLLGIFYPHKGMQLSEWGFRIDASNHPGNQHIWRPANEEITNRRLFVIGHEDLECLEYTPEYLGRSSRDQSSTVFVNCDGSGQFSARFGVDKIQLPAFYKILEGTKEK